jgi:hypothetical protein
MLQQIGRPERAGPPQGFTAEITDLARIVAVVQSDPEAQIGSAWYFIRDVSGEGGRLYRLVPGNQRAAPRIEPVDGPAHGIEADDLDTAIGGVREYEECPGLFRVTDLVHRKLSALDDSC